ncbi:DUF6509 family protein [Bacillus kexueae]|uniref:DUF6509 family protein n=1 Tax=Aeribacillus kexueae TaxID=2078952 RepID=UPI001FAFF8B8|nr:DUF6509 family protein [Bacillus kexueae]
MNITSYTVERLHDPTGILDGDRYEFMLDVQVDEEDELFRENGVQVRVILAVTAEDVKIAQYHILEAGTNQHLDFELEEEELDYLLQFCQDHKDEAE